jgi:hypothetical protein
MGDVVAEIAVSGRLPEMSRELSSTRRHSGSALSHSSKPVQFAPPPK